MDPNSENNNIKYNVKSKKILAVVLGLAALAFVIFASFGIGFELGKKKGNNYESVQIPLKKVEVVNEISDKNTLDFSLFWKSWDELKNNYVDADKLDATQMLYGSIKGMLKSTGDPYNAFFSPEENKKFNEEITGSFEGIGAEIGMKNNVLTIIAPLKESPAEKAGIRAGDKILKINDESSEDMTVEEAVGKIRGPKNSEVKLTIFRNGDPETKEIIVKREIINVKSAMLEFKGNEGDIAYVELSRFGNDTNRDFGAIAREITSKKIKGIILDLRDNPGGYLDASINVASRMIPKGKIVVIEEDSKGNKTNSYAGGGDLLSEYFTVVLINEGSASASEILAGALRENRENVTIVGKKSFGKGSVQKFIDLEKGTAMKVTVAKWLTPKGNQINDEGIHPDMDIDLSEDDFNNNRDPQLDKAIEIINNIVK
ncbi:MAG: hypothetical protein A3J63_01815 [Candidatus Moranbacteria bacterium RIFCSPHIGHO2_02_FULL_40_12b]|nr:MAG: hypothetical protein A3J63_01815 [Candidatus Moranbacteria bacterium RIFCSPHIGHO2_02_FULL_40_12b]OGI23464.1 MAG: hypothetical protein A3E91_01605 [Candidatus Moranbacteria bacterium RIFCSPHIGHO2_12_FULL_40_10]